MAQFSVNATRFDPYKNFKFRVKWDGRYVAGVSKVSALKRTTEVVEHREGGDPSTSRKSPGRTKYEPITLERGVTHDVEFERWANKVWNFGSGLGAEVSLKDFRKDMIVEVYNEAGQLALALLVPQQGGPAARPGISETGAIGVDLDVFHCVPTGAASRTGARVRSGVKGMRRLRRTSRRAGRSVASSAPRGESCAAPAPIGQTGPAP